MSNQVTFRAQALGSEYVTCGGNNSTPSCVRGSHVACPDPNSAPLSGTCSSSRPRVPAKGPTTHPDWASVLTPSALTAQWPPSHLRPLPSPSPCPPPVRALSSDESHCADVPLGLRPPGQPLPPHCTQSPLAKHPSDLVTSLKTVVRDPGGRPASSTGFPKSGMPARRPPAAESPVHLGFPGHAHLLQCPGQAPPPQDQRLLTCRLHLGARLPGLRL